MCALRGKQLGRLKVRAVCVPHKEFHSLYVVGYPYARVARQDLTVFQEHICRLFFLPEM